MRRFLIAGRAPILGVACGAAVALCPAVCGAQVKVSANGRQQITKIEIEREVINPDDVEMLVDLIVAAVNKALEDSNKMAQQEMSKATSGLLPNIPGLTLPGL